MPKLQSRYGKNTSRKLYSVMETGAHDKIISSSLIYVPASCVNIVDFLPLTYPGNIVTYLPTNQSFIFTGGRFRGHLKSINPVLVIQFIHTVKTKMLPGPSR
jgi:hypothetical protein